MKYSEAIKKLRKKMIPRLNPEHLISNLWNQQSKGDFDLIFDSTMIDIADKNIDIFSTQTSQNTKHYCIFIIEISATFK